MAAKTVSGHLSNVGNDIVKRFTSRQLPEKVDNSSANQPKSVHVPKAAEVVVTTTESRSPDNSTISRPLTAKEFFWDDLLSYLASAIVALALVDISVEFLAGSSLSLLCLTPLSNNTLTVNFDRDQSAFVNSFCSRYISIAEFYPLFTLVQGIALFSPHHIWLSIYSKYFDFFFALVSMLERLRERNTGSYSSKNASIIQRLEQEFGNQATIRKWYWAKLGAQIFLYLLFISLTFGVFRDFSQDITCPPLSEDSLPEFGRINCVYARFRLLNVLRIANVVILIIGVIVILVGVYNMSTSEFLNAKSLNYKQVAVFSYHSALHSSHFYATFKGTRFKLPHLSRQSSDMDFMHFKLFATDAGYANVLRENQVSNEISKLLEADYQLQYIRANKNIFGDADDDDESVVTNETASNADTNVDASALQVDHKPEDSPKLKSLQAFVDYVCAKCTRSSNKRTAALDICFHRHSYMFSMAERFSRVASLHFDEHYHGEARNEVYSIGEIHSIRVPTNILALPYEQIEKLTNIVRQFLEYKQRKRKCEYPFHLIVVSGVDDDTKGAAVSHMLKILSLPNAGYIADGALLLVLNAPVEINGRRTTNKKVKLQIDAPFMELSVATTEYKKICEQFSLKQVNRKRNRISRVTPTEEADSSNLSDSVCVSCGEEGADQASHVEYSFQFSLYKYHCVTLM